MLIIAIILFIFFGRSPIPAISHPRDEQETTAVWAFLWVEVANKRRSHIAIAIKFDNVSHAIMNDTRGRTPHMKGVGMLVVSLRGIKFGLT